MRINTTIPAITTSMTLMRAERRTNLSMERLSSGRRINSVSDDPAGMSISLKMRSQIRGLEMGARNTLDGISITQTAEGTLGEMQSMVQRIRELAVTAANGTLTTQDRLVIAQEVNQLAAEIDAMAGRTEFNRIKLFDGSLSQRGLSRENGIESPVAVGVEIEENTPVGFFNYQIARAPMPGQTLGYIDPAAIYGPGMMFINGEAITLSGLETGVQVMGMISERCKYLGIDVKTPDFPAAGPLVLTTLGLGNDSFVEIGGDPVVLAELHMTAGIYPGSDIVLSGAAFTGGDLNRVRVSGNTVSVVPEGQGGFHFNVPININPDGTLGLLNGVGINPDGTLAAPVTGLAIEITDLGPFRLQMGPDQGMEMIISIPSLSSRSLGLYTANLSTAAGAQAAIGICDAALETISMLRARLGAYQNRLESATLSQSTTTINMESSLSRIQDTDMAREMTTYTQANIIAQAAISILAQANQRPQQILQLL